VTKRSSAAALAAAAAMAATQAGATAFQLREGSASAEGSALAGRTANDRDVSLSLQNPAALRGIRGVEVSGGLAGILVFNDATADGPGGGAFAGFTRIEDEPGVHAAIPSLALGWRATDRLVLGLSVKTPFGLATEYESDFATAPLGTKSDLLTVSVTPQVSFDVTPTLSIGAGVTAQYADAELSQTLPGLGEISVTGDGFAFGFALGAIWEPFQGTKLGLAYQSGFRHSLEGSFSDNYDLTAFGGPDYSGLPGEADFDLPPLVSLGVIQDVSDKWRVMAEFEWTGWDAFDTLTLSSPGNGVADLPDPQGYENSFFLSLGAEYDYSERLTLRGGVGFDKSPTTDEMRTVRTPDSDRFWAALGASYALTEDVAIDASYVLVLPQDTTVTRTRLGDTLDFGPDRVDYENQSVHVFSVNLNYRF
jgi:long-chain fatty acid transport protein